MPGHTGPRYQAELANLANTYADALSRDISDLKRAIAGASESSLIAVGSGGSFTGAALLCNLHEAYTGRVSRPATPLEIICNPGLAASSPAFLISAEGKNPDISEALQRARRHSARAVHVVTNRQDSPLIEMARQLTDIGQHVFELAQKDGYLATNSLLFTSVLIARAYEEWDGSHTQLPATFDDLRVGDATIAEWSNAQAAFVEQVARRGALLVTFSPALRPVATDLESKLAEAALTHCQLADLRSFAHGRHLWLSERPNDLAILALTDEALNPLWQSTRELLPPGVPIGHMHLGGTRPRDIVAALAAQMFLVGAIGDRLGRDPGAPDVQAFGRQVHYMDLSQVIRAPEHSPEAGLVSKSNVLGSTWPSPAAGRTAIRRARDAYVDSLAQRAFRAVVFDYDGTLCSSSHKDKPPSPAVIAQLTRLIRHGVVVGIASGRGTTISKDLAKVCDVDVLERLYIGLYSGGLICRAAEPPVPAKGTSEFLSHVTRIAWRLKALGVPIEDVRDAHPYQVSIRFRDGLQTEQMWFIVADALRQSGLSTDTLLRSRHSVDVLAPGVGKSGLVAHVIQEERINPYELLTVGDQGAWPGNDVALLEHRHSLSVDAPSRRLDRGWKLSPAHLRNVDATLWHLERFSLGNEGFFHLTGLLGN